MSIIFIIISILIPPLGIPLGLYGLWKNYKKWRSYIFCIALSLACIAYCYIPIHESDLVRYFQQFEKFATYSFSEIIHYDAASGLSLYFIFGWLIGSSGDLHLAPMITVFVIYYIGLYVTCRVGEDLTGPKKEVFKYVIFLLLGLNFHSIINNIRNIFSFSIIGLAIFRDCYLRKRNVFTFLLYICPIFFHTSAILFLGLRLIIGLKKWRKYVFAILLLFTPLIISLFHSLLINVNSDNSIKYLFKFAVDKGYRYFNDTNSAWGLDVKTSGSYTLSRILYIGLAIVISFGLFYYWTNTKYNYRTNLRMTSKKAAGLEKMTNFTLYTALLTISCVTMLTPEYWRFASSLILFAGVPYLRIKELTYNKTLFRQLSTLCFIIALPCCALWVRDFCIHSDLKSVLLDPFLSSPLFILIKNLI